jgi:hypothetical protein
VGSNEKAATVLGYRPEVSRIEDIVASAWRAPPFKQPLGPRAPSIPPRTI